MEFQEFGQIFLFKEKLMIKVKKSQSLLCYKNNISSYFECFSHVVLSFPACKVCLEPVKEPYSLRFQGHKTLSHT